MAEILSTKVARPRRAASTLESLDDQMNAAVAEIETADRKSLLDRWEQYFGRPAPSHIRENLLRRALAHEAQMLLTGASARAVRRRVERLIKARPGPKRKVIPTIRLSPGVRLVREWRGEVHQVSVLAKGFEYRGLTYKSLSEIARLITGARWSGPLFFGLKETRDAR